MVISWFEKHYKVSVAITLIGAIAIFYISSLTFQKVSYTIDINSILYHFFAFFFFALFLQISSLRGQKRFAIFVLAILISIVYGVMDELHQSFVPGRVCTLFDAGIDSVGVIIASAIYFIRVEYKNNTK